MKITELPEVINTVLFYTLKSREYFRYPENSSVMMKVSHTKDGIWFNVLCLNDENSYSLDDNTRVIPLEIEEIITRRI